MVKLVYIIMQIHGQTSIVSKQHHNNKIIQYSNSTFENKNKNIKENLILK